MRVLSRKRKHILDDDCISVGAAARGHILESYAIDLWNNHSSVTICPFTIYHWDDIIVADDVLGYSPDGLNIPMPKTYLPKVNNDWIEPTTLVEVKSYNNESHWIKGHTSKSDLEERWQIATAMAVSETIERGFLFLFNPSSMEQLYVHSYHRIDLLDEIKTIYEIRDEWTKFLAKESGITFSWALTLGGSLSEEEIWEAEQRKKELNPDD